MIYKGYKIRVRCLNWEQTQTIDRYWKLFTSHIAPEKLVGLGMNWSDDYLYFDYALGVIDDKATLNQLKSVATTFADFNPNYFEINLPEMEEWTTFKGKDCNVKQIYEEVDCYEIPYDYELEYIDSDGNIEIKIHYTYL